MFFAGARHAVVFCAASVFCLPPFGIHQPVSLQALKRRHERTGIHLEHVARNLFDAARHSESMHGLEAERLENKHVERAGNYVGIWVVGQEAVRESVGGLYKGFILIVKMMISCLSRGHPSARQPVWRPLRNSPGILCPCRSVFLRPLHYISRKSLFRNFLQFDQPLLFELQLVDAYDAMAAIGFT